MKKTLAAIAVVAMVFMATSAMAAGAKVPKTLCLDWNSFADYQQLTMKALGTIPDPAAKVKTYAITGHVFNGSYGPVAGSGYIVPGTSIFRATYEGMMATGGYGPYTVCTYELSFDLIAGTGTIKYYYSSPSGSVASTQGVTAMDCTMLSVGAEGAETGPVSSEP